MKRIFKLPDSKEKILNKCPICGAPLEYHSLMQYANVYTVLKNGTLSKNRKRKSSEGPMECGFLACTECGFHTDCDLNAEDEKGLFIYQDGDKFMYSQDT